MKEYNAYVLYNVIVDSIVAAGLFGILYYILRHYDLNCAISWVVLIGGFMLIMGVKSPKEAKA